MRAVVISDVHGEYDKMIAALDAVQFDKDKDILVSNGDLIDRGPKVMECIRYVLNCPHHLIILGNHEYMFLEMLLDPTRGFTLNDFWNGEGATLGSIFNIHVSGTEGKNGLTRLYWGAKDWSWMEMIDRHQSLAPVFDHADAEALTNLKDFISYIEQGYSFIKFYNRSMNKKYFITHGWPSAGINEKLDEDMMVEREIYASWILASDWTKDCFIDSPDAEKRKNNPLITSRANNATIIVGHEWAFRMRYIYHLLKNGYTFKSDVEYLKAIPKTVRDDNFYPFDFDIECFDSNGKPSANHIIMIDGCSNAELGRVNALPISDIEFIDYGESIVARRLNQQLKNSKYAALRNLAK